MSGVLPLAAVRGNPLMARPWHAGVEEYTQQHWDIMSPDRLGFKGQAQAPADAEQLAAETMMASFFAPHNADLAALMAKHGWPWRDFA